MIDYNPTPMPNRKVITRFAPSPTGYLHIGGARTALFNWAFARQHGGTFILRIEDTDRARSTAESTRRIIEDLRWLGLDWDEGPTPDTDDPYDHQIDPAGVGPYFQSQRLDRYRQHIDRLIDAGRAYKCFKTPDELKADRDQAKAEKRAYKYDRTESINLPPEVVARYEAEGKPFVIRFQMPNTDITIDDLVLGSVTVKAEELEDFIILKSDGYPTFHLANVVDDALMGVTHVLRAQEHLMNTPKHVALQDALGFDRPKYAHMPLIFNTDGSKMSKRDKAKVARTAAKEWIKARKQVLPASNDTKIENEKSESYDTLAELSEIPTNRLTAFIQKKNDDTDMVEALAHPHVLNLTLPEIDVHDFRHHGYLPQVVLNYISLLGWSPGNDIERFDLNFLVKNFDLARIGKTNARFDRAKLLAFNTEALSGLSDAEFKTLLMEYEKQFPSHLGSFHQHMGDSRFTLFANCYRQRSRTLKEPFDNGQFFLLSHDRIVYDPKAIQKVFVKNDHEGLRILKDLRPLLANNPHWTTHEIETMVKHYATEHDLGLGKVAQPLRVAVSGNTISPPIFDTLNILGQDKTLARIDYCLTNKQQLINLNLLSAQPQSHR